MLEVKILGAGCPKSKRLESEICAVLNDAHIDFRLTKVTNYLEIIEHGAIQTPALILNNKLVVQGRIPRRQQIVTWACDCLLQAQSQ